MDKFIIADPHLDHENIIKYCKRPFKNKDEMNEVIIKNWNDKIPTTGLVYILGDLVFAKDAARARHLISRLNGHKILVYGNHDKICQKTDNLGLQSRVHYIEDDIYDGEDWRKLVMFHYPMFSWNKQRHGSWHAYGHCHGSVVQKMNLMHPGTWDVGVDVNDFTPLSFDELATRIKTTYSGGNPTKLSSDHRDRKRD